MGAQTSCRTRHVLLGQSSYQRTGGRAQPASHLTIRPSRRRFAARLNSGVRCHIRMLRPRTISSAQTFIMKLVFPVLWISGFGFGTALLWLDVMHGRNGTSPPGEMKWMFLVMWLVGSALILWSCARLKRVRLDDKHIYVSNFRREISIPLSLIENVSEVRWINIHPVTIHLRKDTEFGRSITFMPKVRFFALWSSHPIVAELMHLSRQVAPNNSFKPNPLRGFKTPPDSSGGSA